MRFVAGAGCRGFAPAPPGFIAWCLSRCWARCRKRMKGGCRSIPLIDRSRPLSRRSGCFQALPYPPLSSGSFYCGGIKKRIFAVGSEGMTLKAWGKWSKRRITFPPKEVLSMLSSNVKYIGLDVHKEAVAIAVLNGAGKLVMESIVETKASTLLDFLQGLRGDLHVTLEEGTWAAWLYDVLKPHVAEIVVCNPRRNALLKEGSKSDKIDARRLAELLRSGMLRAVYHGENGLGTLRELARGYLTISKDQARVMSRLKAMYRSWGIPCSGMQVYAPRHRDQWLSRITQPGVRRRAELLYQQMDGLLLVRHTVRGELLVESRKHQAVKILRQISLDRPASGCLIAG